MKKRKPVKRVKPQKRKPVKRKAQPKRKPVKRVKRKPVKRKPVKRAKLKPRRKRRLSRSKRNIKRRIRYQKLKAFGYIPKREPREGSKHTMQPVNFEDRLTEEQVTEVPLPWADEDEFIARVTGMGLTEREAYTLWFS